MPKATRANDSTTPKKRSRKTKADDGIGTEVVEPVKTSPASAVEALPEPILEEKIRHRAYELYLQRGGQGGSPEQDWLQAVQDIRSQHVA